MTLSARFDQPDSCFPPPPLPFPSQLADIYWSIHAAASAAIAVRVESVYVKLSCVPWVLEERVENESRPRHCSN